MQQAQLREKLVKRVGMDLSLVAVRTPAARFAAGIFTG